MNIIKLLQQPFPNEHSIIRELRHIGGVAVFVFLFLYIIQPFGMDNYPHSKLALSAGFGLVTFLVGSIYQLLIYFVLRIRKDIPTWTFGKWILNALTLVLFIAVGNYIFQYWMENINTFSAWMLLGMMITTLKVAIFPIIFLGTITYFRSLRQNERIAAELPQQPPTPISTKILTIQAANGNIELTLPAADFRYAEAMQNYVAIFYQKDGQLCKTLVRNTLTAIEQQLADSTSLRCHRSYLVNRQAITEIGGNAQGLKLALRDVEGVIIPVSRKYISEFR